ncbi:MAG TPA: hypothetical protein VHZ03_54965 [Trebonia sp.]|jgi:hypothetical protein|nr:hypothetical protein [Trebonia sp.]
MRMTRPGVETGPQGADVALVSTPAQRGRIGAHVSWSRTIDRAARTEPGRKGFLARFEREVDPDGVLPEGERVRLAEHARKAHMQKLALISAARRRKASPRSGR